MTDHHWLMIGISRVLAEQQSGRGFLQNFESLADFCPSRSTFFEGLKSQRRLQLCQDVNNALFRSAAQNDMFDKP
jgi:hypothetical protein